MNVQSSINEELMNGQDLLSCHINTLIAILVDKKVCTTDEFTDKAAEIGGIIKRARIATGRREPKY